MPPCRLQFSWLLIKRMGKDRQRENSADEPMLLERGNSADEPMLLERENSADETNILGRLTGKILETIDFQQLSDSVAARIASKIQTCDLVDRLLEKYQHEIQAAIIEALVQQL